KTTLKWMKSSKNKKLAQIELGKYELNKDRGRIGLDCKELGWADVRALYMDYSIANKAPASVALDRQLFNNIDEFCPYISNVQDLNIYFAESFFVWLKENKNNTEATIKRKGTTLKNLGSKLVDWHILNDNPFKRLKLPKVRYEKEIKYWYKPEDIQKVVEKSSGVWKAINFIGFCIGARISEILNLTWESFDLERNIYKIQSIDDFRTKSRKFRVGAIPPVLKEYLLNLKQEQAQNEKIKTNKIIVYADGSRPTMQTASTYLRKFYKRIGFEGFHPHCLRHTFATLYLAKNKDIYGLSKLLGHHSVQITEQYYGHLLGNYFDTAMQNFNPFGK
ncbi:MAG: site-specific integrase, partial [Elusimicrobiota bacterium]|nr:site-specific integrase [Elusimicrobiota bacterium]